MINATKAVAPAVRSHRPHWTLRGEDYADQVVDEVGGAPWSNFRFVQDVVPSPGEGNRIHLHNLAIAELLFDARNAYITEAVGLTWQQLFDTGCSLIIRRLEIDYEREVLAGIPLKVGVRAITRSRRSVTFDEVVWRVDLALPIAVAGSVHVVVRFDTPGAIELPDDVVNKFESYEGHPLVGMP